MQYPKLVCLLAVAGLLAGCMSSRIAAHEEAWQKLSKQDQERLGHGAVRAGDTEELVRIALGAPDEVLLITRPEGQQVVWLYDLTVLRDTGNYHHLDLFNPGFERMPNGEKRITFQDGVVVNETETGTAEMGLGGPGTGQGGVNWEVELANLDEAVGLTLEQRFKAREILEKKAAALNAIPPAERIEQGMPLRQTAAAELNALLTPEQRQKRNDHYRTGHAQEMAQERAERAFVADFVRSSKSITARLGAVKSLSFLNASSSQSDFTRRGRHTYTVVGEKNSETLKIYWENGPAAGSMKIVKIEAGDGTVIPL